MSNQRQSRPRAEYQNKAQLPSFNIQNVDVDLFDKTAEDIAIKISKGTKPNQIRKFYSEIENFTYLIQLNSINEDEFVTKMLPLIKMIRSKSVYAQSRKHASLEFVGFITNGVKQINTINDLQNFKLLFEAVIGFAKDK